MKIIRIDTFDRETVSDALIAENVPVLYAGVITETLNRLYGDPLSTDYFEAVDDDYELYKFQP